MLQVRYYAVRRYHIDITFQKLRKRDMTAENANDDAATIDWLSRTSEGLSSILSMLIKLFILRLKHLARLFSLNVFEQC